MLSKSQQSSRPEMPPRLHHARKLGRIEAAANSAIILATAWQGFVTRTGRAHRFKAAIPDQESSSSVVGDLLRAGPPGSSDNSVPEC